MQPGMIPPELRALPQFVVWKAVTREGRQTKVLFDPKTGGVARTHNAEGKTYTDRPEDTWATFDVALHAYNRAKGAWNGIGFVFTEHDPYCGIDLDSARRNGRMTEEAERVVGLLDSYTEVSPSGNGIHIIVRGNLPPTGRRKGHVEMYDSARYFTLTGNVLAGHTEIEDRQEQLDILHGSIFGTPGYAKGIVRPVASKLSLTDSQIVDKARAAKDGGKFIALYDCGNVAMYGDDDSRADLALCNMLRFWTGADESAIDRLFRSSSLYREKWDRADYNRRTIQKCLAGEVYSPNGTSASNGGGYATTMSTAPKAGDSMRVSENPEGEPFSYHLTQDGDALRLLDRYGQDLRIFGDRWRVWDGIRWAESPDCEVMERIRSTCMSVYDDAKRCDDEAFRKMLLKHALRTETAAHRKAVEVIARQRLHLFVGPEKVDTHDFRLNCANGTVNLKNGCLQDAAREDLMTKMTPVEYDPHAESALWSAFLDRVVPDPDVRAFVQRAAGYALTGDVSEQCFFFLFGSGRNGKSVFLKTLLTTMGEYASQSSAELLLATRGERLRPEIAALKGQRLVTTIEIADGRRLAENLVKQLTGGDRINARFLHENPFEFDPTHKIFIAANHRPVIRGTDLAIWRRIMLVPFTETIREDEADPHLGRKLQEELPAVLNWCVQGCLMWQQRGLNPPAIVKSAVEEYRAEQDIIGQFMEERCVMGPGRSINATQLYQAYKSWCIGRGDEAQSITPFGRAMTEKGHLAIKKGGQILRVGISLSGEDLAL